MAYVALYREWRPKKFADIVGQDHISRTLQNAIEANRIAHAYLFCGPRGTGKTSTAKVLAKALNCLKRDSLEPCNQCENCGRINEGTSYDVIEIDAASNRGIDEIRDLREKVRFAPVEGKYKIYIIDEVHMLTTEAFNALLKTLEEPPSYVIFVLATTEPHKIPLTILSRCQRFDFRQISLRDTIDRLKYIAQQKNIDINEDALRVIAKRAEGGMRDALSILDQSISFSGKRITTEDITTILGTVNEEMLQNIGTAIIEKDTTHCLQLIDETLKQGKDARQFINDLIEYFRNILLVHVCNQVEGLVNVSADALTILNNQSRIVPKETILRVLDILTNTEKDMKWTTQPRLILEVGVIKASQLENDISIENLIRRLEEMEEQLKSGAVVKAKEMSTNNPIKERPLKKGSQTGKKIKEKEEVSEENLDCSTDDPENTTKIKNSWTEVLTLVKKLKISAYAFLVEGKPLFIKNKTLFLGFKEDYTFHKEQVEQADNKIAVEKALEKLTGVDLKVKCIFNKDALTSNKKETSPDQNPLVQEAIKVFGGEVIEIND